MIKRKNRRDSNSPAATTNSSNYDLEEWSRKVDEALGIEYMRAADVADEVADLKSQVKNLITQIQLMRQELLGKKLNESTVS